MRYTFGNDRNGYIGADFLKDNSGNPSSLFTAKLEPGIRYRFFSDIPKPQEGYEK